MPNPRLATRYAKSLLDLALERGQLEQVYNDMQFLQQLMTKSRDFVNMLRSPVIPAATKQNVFQALTNGKISELTYAFTKLLVGKAREESLPEIVTAFVRQYKQHKNIHTVKLTTAVPVSDAVKQSIISRVQATSNMQNIELETAIDPDLIGGFVLQAGDKLVDASIANNLKEVHRQFENNDFIYNIR